MTNLKELVNSIKNLIKNEGSQVSLIDINGNTVLFTAATAEDIVEGVIAEPDGEYVFSDGRKITVEGGKVVKVETIVEEKKEEEVETVVTEPVAEVVEEEKTVVEETIVEEPQPDEKDILISELQKANDELKATVEELRGQLEGAIKTAEEKTAEISEISKDLEEIRNFYSKVSNNALERTITETEEKSEKQAGFRYSRKK